MRDKIKDLFVDFRVKLNLVFLFTSMLYISVTFALIPSIFYSLVTIIISILILFIFVVDSPKVIEKEQNKVETALNFVENAKAFIKSEKVESAIYYSAFSGISKSDEDLEIDFYTGDKEFKNYILSIYSDDSVLSDLDKLQKVREKYSYAFLSDFFILMMIYKEKGILTDNLDYKLDSVLHRGESYLEDIKKDYYTRKSGWGSLVGFCVFLLIILVGIRYIFGDIYTVWITSSNFHNIVVSFFIIQTTIMMAWASRRLKVNDLYAEREL